MRCRYGQCHEHHVQHNDLDSFAARHPTYVSARYPHWYGRPIRRTPEMEDKNRSKQQLMEHIRLLHAQNKEMEDKNLFLQMRMKLVMRERQRLNQKYNRMSEQWEDARLLTETMRADFEKNISAVEVLLDESPYGPPKPQPQKLWQYPEGHPRAC